MSCGAKTVVVGPSTPLSPLLFDHGASLLAGTVVRDAATVWSHVAEGGDRSIFQHGAEMMKITAADRKVPSQSQEIVGTGGATMAVNVGPSGFEPQRRHAFHRLLWAVAVVSASVVALARISLRTVPRNRGRQRVRPG